MDGEVIHGLLPSHLRLSHLAMHKGWEDPSPSLRGNLSHGRTSQLAYTPRRIHWRCARRLLRYSLTPPSPTGLISSRAFSFRQHSPRSLTLPTICGKMVITMGNPTMTKLPIYYLGRTNEGNGQAIVTLAIGPVRWDYWLPTQKAESAEYLARKVGPAKALAYAKRHSTAQVRQ